MHSVSVIIITRHRPAMLDDCLRSLAAIKDQGLDIIVVDNSDAGRADTEDVVLKWRGVQYVRVPPCANFQTVTRNRGADLTRGEIVAFLDDDTIVDGIWLNACRSGYADPCVGCVGGVILDPEVEHLDHGRDAPILRLRANGDFTDNCDCNPGHPVQVHLLRGCNYSIRRDVFEACGRFDERLLGYGFQDLDIQIRIQQLGYRVMYVPEMQVYHHIAPREVHPRGTATYGKVYVLHRNMSYVHAKNFGLRSLRCWLCFLGYQNGLRRLVRRPSWWNAEYCIAGLHGRIAGIRQYVGSRSKLRREGCVPRLSGMSVQALPRLEQDMRVGRHEARSVRQRGESTSGPHDHSTASVSVVIITRHRPAMLDDCLRSLAAVKDQGLDIVVVDNSDTGRADTEDVVLKWCGVQYVRVPPCANFQTVTRNRGAGLTRGEIVAFLDDDTVVDGTWLGACRSGYADPCVGCVGGVILDPEVEHLDHGRDAPILQLRANGEFTDNCDCNPGHPVQVHLLRGCNYSIRRDVFQACGRFDERLLGYGFEDLDIQIRIQQLGYRVMYVPEMQVYHRIAPREIQPRGAVRYVQIYGLHRNMSYIHAKNFGLRSVRCWLCFLGYHNGLRRLVRRPSWWSAEYCVAGLHGRMAGIRQYVGSRSKLRQEGGGPRLSGESVQALPSLCAAAGQGRT